MATSQCPAHLPVASPAGVDWEDSSDSSHWIPAIRNRSGSPVSRLDWQESLSLSIAQGNETKAKTLQNMKASSIVLIAELCILSHVLDTYSSVSVIPSEMRCSLLQHQRMLVRMTQVERAWKCQHLPPAYQLPRNTRISAGGANGSLFLKGAIYWKKIYSCYISQNLTNLTTK